MEEYCGASPRHDRIVIKTQHDYKVVNVVLAPKVFSAGRIGPTYQSIVVGVSGFVTPTIRGLKSSCRQPCLGMRNSITPIIQPTQRPKASWRRPVALPFGRDLCDPGAT
jgi:hypothetical protein